MVILKHRFQKFVTAQRKNMDLLDETINFYQSTHTELDTCINTFRNSNSNGPLEGINRKIKFLKRGCYGFSNIEYFFKRLIVSLHRN
ncbi:transposase [Limosilactobacillus gastricus]|uniref:transposase n=1 Tax=Limosilactobacillus gastricus TaxID=227942 RepID=UPI0023DA6564|nr:transposase [Limosilactobacillus gastricus]